MPHFSPRQGADFKVKPRDIMALEAKITGPPLRPLPDHAQAAMEYADHCGKIRLDCR
jgi:hypothetical protein